MYSKYWLASFCTIGGTVYLCENIDVTLPLLIKYYLNDFIIVPLTALVARTLLRFYFKTGTLIFTSKEVLFIALFYSVLFELILPFYFPRYTADAADILMYLLGGMFYLLFLNRS